jgi:hypothetical protein
MKRVAIILGSLAAATCGTAARTGAPVITATQGPVVREAPIAQRGTSQRAPTSDTAGRVTVRGEQKIAGFGRWYGRHRGAWLIRKPRRGSAYVAVRG